MHAHTATLDTTTDRPPDALLGVLPTDVCTPATGTA